MEKLFHRFGGNRRRKPDETPEGEVAQSIWFRTYALTAEDESFMERMRGRTLMPTTVRLPSGRLITGNELRQWFAAHRSVDAG